MSTDRAITPVRTGWCAEGRPLDHWSHARCTPELQRRETPDALLVCPCECHVVIAEVLDDPVVAAILGGLVTPTGVLATDAAPDTDEWFAARRLGITGTDLPKILGETKYGNALSVWMDKRGELADDGAGEAARWGHILEEPVAQEWAEREGATVRRIGVVAHAEQSWLRASLDRVVDECPDGDEACGLEIKTRSAFKATDWRDGMPDDVLAQVAWGRLVTGLDHMHVAALIGGQRLTAFRYDRDDVLEAYLLDAARHVWTAVEAGTPPEVHPDAEGVLLNLLDRIHADRAGSVDLDPDAVRPWLDQYAEGGDLERRAKALKTEAKTALVQMLGDGQVGLVDDVPAFTYKAPASSFGLPADEERRLRKEMPDLWRDLADHHFLTESNPRPRFTVSRRKDGS